MATTHFPSTTYVSRLNELGQKLGAIPTYSVKQDTSGFRCEVRMAGFFGQGRVCSKKNEARQFAAADFLARYEECHERSCDSPDIHSMSIEQLITDMGLLMDHIKVQFNELRDFHKEIVERMKIK